MFEQNRNLVQTHEESGIDECCRALTVGGINGGRKQASGAVSAWNWASAVAVFTIYSGVGQCHMVTWRVTSHVVTQSVTKPDPTQFWAVNTERALFFQH